MISSTIVANSLFALARAFSFAYAGLKAAKVLHESVIIQVLGVSINGTPLTLVLIAKQSKAKISFFDSHPVGRLINRFSTDQYSIGECVSSCILLLACLTRFDLMKDDSLPFIANILLANVWSIIGTLIIILIRFISVQCIQG